MKKLVSVISLGCDKNRVDTEKMLYQLSQAGHELINDFNKAQIIIVNTCAFIESARKEAIETVLEAAQYKSASCEKLIVTGCLPQKYHEEISTLLTEADAFIGIADYERIGEVIANLYKGDPNFRVLIGGEDHVEVSQRLLTTPTHYAYVKIADGCDNHCTFCTIPSIRGKYRSRTINSIVSESKRLVDSGVKEIILVAQDVTRYGTDLYNKLALVDLLKELVLLDVHWIRLMYCYPELVTDELIDFVASQPKMVKYLDIPVQHTHARMLKLMNRRGTNEQLFKLMKKLEEHDIAVRTTVMVGFPSETEEEFNELKQFVASFKPMHVGVFAYSKESDTPSAKIKGHLTTSIKRMRVKEIGQLHLQNCIQRNAAMVGKTLRVLYEDIDYDKNLFKGRACFSAPEVDTYVYFKADFADVGNFYDVTITGYDNYDLIGEVKHS